MSLKHSKVVTQADSADSSKLRPSDWGSTFTDYDTTPTHEFTGGNLGALLSRDTGSVDGSSWVESAAGVLACAGAGQAPSFRSLLAGDIPDLSASYEPAFATLGVSKGGTGLNTLLAHALYVGNGTGVPAAVAVGATGTVLTGVTGGDPVWSASPSLTSILLGTPLAATSGGTGFASYVVGDLVYASTATALSKLAAVAAGQVLASGGVGAAPAYTASPSLTSILLGNGNAGAPAIANATFTTTGPFWEAGPIYSISVGGTKRVSVSATALTSAVPIIAPAGSGLATVSVGGMLTVSTTQSGTGADTAETDLWTYSLPANALSANNKGVRVTAWGSYGGNANSKTVKPYFGTALVANTSASNGGSWKLVWEVLRTAASAQIAGVQFMNAVFSQVNFWSGTTAADTTAAITIKLTGQNGSASANDIVFRGAIVEYIG